MGVDRAWDAWSTPLSRLVSEHLRVLGLGGLVDRLCPGWLVGLPFEHWWDVVPEEHCPLGRCRVVLKARCGGVCRAGLEVEGFDFRWG